MCGEPFEFRDWGTRRPTKYQLGEGGGIAAEAGIKIFIYFPENIAVKGFCGKIYLFNNNNNFWSGNKNFHIFFRKFLTFFLVSHFLYLYKFAIFSQSKVYVYIYVLADPANFVPPNTEWMSCFLFAKINFGFDERNQSYRPPNFARARHLVSRSVMSLMKPVF